MHIHEMVSLIIIRLKTGGVIVLILILFLMTSIASAALAGLAQEKV